MRPDLLVYKKYYLLKYEIYFPIDITCTVIKTNWIRILYVDGNSKDLVVIWQLSFEICKYKNISNILEWYTKDSIECPLTYFID